MKLDKYKLITASLVGIAACSGLILTPTHADTPASSSSSANASVTVSNTINLTLTGGDLVIDNLTPGNASDSNIITATITSNSPYGYHLSATTGTSSGTTSLVNTADSNFSFTNLNANKATLNDFSDNTWGYSYSTDNGTTWISGDYGTALSGYNGLTLDNDDSGATGTTLFNNDSYAGSTAVKFKIGAKSSSTQASGTYTGTVNFYAVTNPKPIITFDMAYADAGKEKLNGYYKMQDATPSICSAVDEDQVGQVIDTRDNQVYKIGKLKDGKCWMVENLKLAGGTALSADNTDVDATYINSFTTSNNLTKDGNTIRLPASAVKNSGDDNLTDATQFSTDNYSYVFNSSNTTNCGASGQNTPCYSYYSWDAATLGSGRSITTENTDAPYSICPKGWRLPTSGQHYVTTATTNWKRGDFYRLLTAYGANLESAYNQSTNTFWNNAGAGTTANFLLSGYYLGSTFSSGGSLGKYWSSTSTSSTNSRNLNFTTGLVGSANTNDRRRGFSVRCLLSE